ncbi:hypothetical protein OSB04_004102 [Centaurea solstitialis]|uniref:Uncharacterized protein n=1 Tax=Centaurea solstitialis TaxID=347529 RepID=A0AA38U6L5_9ASTR|nr:hypothetical protein OSB04_004102 [Centaurea solstitialis]
MATTPPFAWLFFSCAFLILLKSSSNILVLCKSSSVPGFYIFGDSLNDPGNNNYLPNSLARADFPYNGIDFPAKKATGRFSNGKTSADFLAEKVGLPWAPPYLSLSENLNATSAVVTGISFASGGSGILNGTGMSLSGTTGTVNGTDDQLYMESIPLTTQVEYYSMVHDQLVQQLGPASAKSHLSKSLFLIVIGSNDLFAYFNKESNLSKQYTPQQYVNLMASTLKPLIKKMHRLGARKFVVSGVPMIGCCPIQRKLNHTDCQVEPNYWSVKYNDALQSLLRKLKSKLSHIKYSYFHLYDAMNEVIQHPRTYAEKVGLPWAPPYQSLSKNPNATSVVVTGVSFASGGSGIFNGTGNWVNETSGIFNVTDDIGSFPLTTQVEYYSVVHDQLVQQLGSAGAESHLSKSLFLIVIGSNDLFAYFNKAYNLSQQYTPHQYIDLMTSNLKPLIKKMHGLGARKFVVIGVGVIGCCPAQRTLNNTECNTDINYWSVKYNDALQSLLTELKSELSDINYSYFHLYDAMNDIIQHPQTYGFTEIKAACCGSGDLNAAMGCLEYYPGTTHCSNRKNHLFWDFVHPTEIASGIFADILYSGPGQFTTPINVKELVKSMNVNTLIRSFSHRTLIFHLYDAMNDIIQHPQTYGN